MTVEELRHYLSLAEKRAKLIKEEKRLAERQNRNSRWLGPDPANPYRGASCCSLINALKRQIQYRLGYEDCQTRRGCLSTNGTYLDGYYSDGELCFVSNSELRELRIDHSR